MVYLLIVREYEEKHGKIRNAKKEKKGSAKTEGAGPKK
jgi:hypothetical protein